MDKREREVIKAIKTQKPISDKEYQELKRKQKENDEWLESLRKNYPGICFGKPRKPNVVTYNNVELDGMTVYFGGEWW